MLVGRQGCRGSEVLCMGGCDTIKMFYGTKYYVVQLPERTVTDEYMKLQFKLEWNQPQLVLLSFYKLVLQPLVVRWLSLIWYKPCVDYFIINQINAGFGQRSPVNGEMTIGLNTLSLGQLTLASQSFYDHLQSEFNSFMSAAFVFVSFVLSLISLRLFLSSFSCRLFAVKPNYWQHEFKMSNFPLCL